MSERRSGVCVISNPREFQSQCLAWQRQGELVGMVPTMGALHAGHLSLVKLCRQHCDRVVVSVFVNPTQFAPGEDFERYPRTLEADVTALGSVGVDAVLAPSAADMYRPGFSTVVQPAKIAQVLEGQFRPNHYAGVTTIVAKLLHLARADVAIFGQKDYQQLAVIQQMARELDMATEIVMGPTCREPDGLAMSSRNRYLNPDERGRALSISRALFACRDRVTRGETDARELAADLMQSLIDGGLDSIDYAVIADGQTLEALDRVRSGSVALVAGHVGRTRLIDNVILEPMS
jgi:pantoate--beta-alanine ligase